MTYKTLETIPYKIFIKIVENLEKNLHLLSAEVLTINELSEIWNSIYAEYSEINPQTTYDKTLYLVREICYLETKYQIIQFSIESLLFAKSPELIELLDQYGYKVSFDNYIESLEKIKRESHGISNKIKNLKHQLPKIKPDSENKKTNTDELLAFYSAVIGFDFDYNTISVTKFLGLQKQVESKIKNIEKQNQSSKSNKS
jgi:Zn-dependent M32 family carboxypeptidase